MKRGPQQREKQKLSMAGMLRVVREVFTQIHDSKKHKEITLVDSLMSALALFSLKSPSLLSFDQGRAEPIVQKNLQTLFKVTKVPCDTYMREILDEVDPREIRKVYLSVFHEIQRGKLLEGYVFLNKGYLCLVDGSEDFTSDSVHCKNCCEKHHKDGRTTYHHQTLGAVIAHPSLRQVIPLCPEPITKQDGAVKNDCERNAFHRFLMDLKQEHPHLKLTIVPDALSANASHVNELLSLGYDFIIVAKPVGNATLYEWVRGITHTLQWKVGNNQYTFRYVNHVPLNDTQPAPYINFLECDWIEMHGKKEKKGRCGWITNHTITEDTVYTLMKGGRARWKIENETFNTLKNQGYQFEHNFGHGKKNLHTIFVLLMMLAFALDQMQEAACALFQAALKTMKERYRLWERLRSFFYLTLIRSWQALWEAISRACQKAPFCDTS